MSWNFFVKKNYHILVIISTEVRTCVCKIEKKFLKFYELLTELNFDKKNQNYSKLEKKKIQK